MYFAAFVAGMSSVVHFTGVAIVAPGFMTALTTKCMSPGPSFYGVGYETTAGIYLA